MFSAFARHRIKTVLRCVVQIALILTVSAFVLVERGATMREASFFLPFSCFSAVLAGPMLIDSYRRNPHQSPRARLTAVITRATGAVLLIVVASLLLVNFFFGYGNLLFPTPEVCVWAFALCVAAASSAAAVLALLVSHVSLNAAKWGFA